MKKKKKQQVQLLDVLKGYKKVTDDMSLAGDIERKSAKRVKKQTVEDIEQKLIDKEEVVETSPLQIGIVGIGSIGTPMAVMLASKGYDVEITKKSDNALTIDNRINLEINGEFGDKSCLIKNVKNNQFTTKKDVIIMCTQSFSTIGALKEVKKYLKPNGIVISMQNVLNVDDVLKVISKDKYIALVVDWTATRINNNQVFVLRKANMHIGAFSDKAKLYLPIVKKILDSVQPTIIQEDMMSFIASRFVLNCALSCVLTITGYKLKYTIAKKTARKLIVGIINETLQVFENRGIKVPPYCGILDYYKFTQKGLSGWWYRHRMFSKFSMQNGNMSSSILKALENRKKSELDSMCARIVEMAKESGIDVPFNETVANFLYDVEEGKESIFMENLNNPCFTNLKIKWR